MGLTALSAEGGDASKAKQLVPKSLRSGRDVEEIDDNTTKECSKCKKLIGDCTCSEKVKKQFEMEEATTAASSGQYATPAFLAKNLKNWRGRAKTQWPGGKFVKIKEKCRTFPYCNQGDINALDLTENEKIKNAINEVARKTGKDKSHIKDLVKKEIEEIIRRGFYKSPITSLVGTAKMDTPIGKIFTMDSNVGAKYE